MGVAAMLSFGRFFTRVFRDFYAGMKRSCPKRTLLQVSLSKLEGEETSTKNDISFLYSQLACTAVDLRPKHYEIAKNNAP